MKIYTKKGDAGKTGLIGGTRVPKDHVRIESYGTVDELNSQLGVLIAHVEDAKRIDFLHGIQSTLFTLGSHLAADPEKNRMTLPEMSAADVEELEKAIDALDEQLPELKNFVLPSGNVASAQAHVARCVCRRAERRVFTLSELAPIPEQALPYLNRLSDYFFNLARQLTVAGGDKEILWTPKTN